MFGKITYTVCIGLSFLFHVLHSYVYASVSDHDPTDKVLNDIYDPAISENVCKAGILGEYSRNYSNKKIGISGKLE